jgi:patatin-related protein
MRMVRATAVRQIKADFDEIEFAFQDYQPLEAGAKNADFAKENCLDEGEQIYRDLSYLLADEVLLREVLEKSSNEQNWREALREELEKHETIKAVRFVVDILSGSSAGGINAIYMAKALACGQKIDVLEKVWKEEGDIAKLLRDENSLIDPEGERISALDEPADPPSLLNSQRMYFKLLKAFKDMDSSGGNLTPPGEPFADEVDLFVTTTDFWGVPIPVRLFDKLIHERNHRRRLHFRYRRGGINDFQPEHYPFLAYAARCTSSFPLAFDPMRLSDTKTVLDKSRLSLPSNWNSYFPEERIKHKQPSVDWNSRVFVDGGTLDNKPFGYAIEALSHRQANVLIDRKLIYVEPKPDLDGGRERISWNHKPDALTNTLNIVSSLPGYETIREDLQQVLERNRLIVRVNYIVSNARKDEYSLLNLSAANGDLEEIIEKNPRLARRRANKEWSALKLTELALVKGQAVYPYYRLRMSAVTDDLARLATRRAGFDDASDYFLAIRSLVRAWRLNNYNKDENDRIGKTIPAFLYDYDFNYRLRRLRFVLQEADKLLASIDKLKNKSFYDSNGEEDSTPDDAQKDKFTADLKFRCVLFENIKENENFIKALKLSGASEILRQKFPMIEREAFDLSSEIPSSEILKADKDELRVILRNFKKRLNEHLKELEIRQQLIEARSVSDKELSEQFKDLNEKFSNVAEKMSGEDLAEIIGEAEGQKVTGDFDLEVSDKRGAKLLERNDSEIEKGIDEIAETLRIIYNGVSENGSLIVREDKSLFGKARSGVEKVLLSESSSKNSLEKAVCGYLRHFYENFDNYDQIIFPITFETPVGEGDIVEVVRISPADSTSLIDEVKTGRKKLAGDTFFSFSAFFNDKWRENDIMWGRLDAVERLIGLVLTGYDLDNASKTGENNDENKSDFSHTSKLKQTLIEESQRFVLSKYESLLGHKKDYITFIKGSIEGSEYEIDRNFDPDSTLKTTERALAVAAKVLRSRRESKERNEVGARETTEANRWMKKTSSLIDYARLLIVEISSDKASLKTYFYLITLPFLIGLLLITPFLLLITPLILGAALIILNIQSEGDGASLAGGIMIVFLSLLIIFYCFKFYEFQKIRAKKYFFDFFNAKLTGR